MPDVAIPKETQPPKGIPTVALLPRNDASFLLRGKRICSVLDDPKSPLYEGAIVVISPKSAGRCYLADS